MRSSKKVQESNGEITIELHPVPAFGYASDRPELSGYNFVGKDSEQALINAKAYLMRYYRSRHYWPINITIKDDDDYEVE